MKIRYIAAIVAAGLVGSSLAAYGPAPKAGKGCGFDAKGVGVMNDNIVSSGVKSSVCWNDRFAISGMVGARYTYTDNDTLDAGNSGLDNELTLNNVNVFADANINSNWSAHIGIADVMLENGSNEYAHSVRVDEAKLHFQHGSMPLVFEAGYGFTNFGEIGNPYQFLRKPTDVIATNQDAHAGFGWTFMDGLYGEVYAVGDRDIAWGGALGFDRRFKDIAVHSKLSFISDNEHLNSVTTNDGKTWGANVAFAFPFGAKVGGAFVMSRDVADRYRIWSVDGAYRFNAVGMESELHAWYAKNRQSLGGSNIFSSGDFADTDATSARFNMMEYQSQNLRNVWSIGYGAQIAPNVDLSLDYVKSNGDDESAVASRDDMSDYTMITATLTGRF